MRRTNIAPWRQRAASLAVAGALALSAGAVTAGLFPAPALAVEDSVTITQRANPDATYDVYRLFTADIDESNAATNVKFSADDDAKSALVAWLKDDNTGASRPYDDWLTAKGRTTAGDDLIPQNMLEYISEEISKSTTVTPDDIQSDNAPWKDGASFASKLADYVKTNSTDFKQPSVAKEGEQYTNDEGYYLFLSTEATVGKDDAATLPIWFPLGGSSTAIDEKAAVPTIDKQVKDPTDQVWQDAEDAEIGKVMDYRITATISADYNSYDEYSIKLTDQLPAGLAPVVTMGTGSIVTSGVTVKVGDNDVTNKFAITYDSASRQLVISHTNLMDDVTGVSQIDPNSTIVVTYQAKVVSTDGAIPTFVENSVIYEYPNNPGSEGKGETDDKVKVYTFGIDIAKTDKSTGFPLAGAGFVIKSNATNKYLAYDSSADEWSWTADAQNAAAEFVTNDSGDLTYTYDSGENTGKTIEYIPGLEAGTYTVTEVTAPEDYALPANPNITVTMVPTYENGKLTSLKAQVSGSIVAGQDVTDVDSDGVIDITVTNDKEFSLAVTGAEGVGLGGAAVLAIGLGWYLVRRHRLSATQE